jgi:hypothetical protein
MAANTDEAMYWAIENWQTVRYRATAMDPARLSWTEFCPRGAKGPDPIANTKTERDPRTTEITILPIDAPPLRFQKYKSEIGLSMYLWAFDVNPTLHRFSIG